MLSYKEIFLNINYEVKKSLIDIKNIALFMSTHSHCPTTYKTICTKQNDSIKYNTTILPYISDIYSISLNMKACIVRVVEYDHYMNL
jgi:hypothetical protein